MRECNCCGGNFKCPYHDCPFSFSTKSDLEMHFFNHGSSMKNYINHLNVRETGRH